MHPGHVPPPPPPGYGWGPYGYGGPPPRSTTPRTLGTLSMVFGGIVTGLSAMGLLMGTSFANFSIQGSQKAAFEAYAEQIHTFSVVQGLVMLLMSASLFYIGMGQRKYAQWSVRASLQWSVLAVVVLAGNFLGQILVVMPAIDDLARNLSHQAVGKTVAMTMKVSAVVGIAFYLPYPLILLSTFRKPAIVAAMEPELPTATLR